MVIRSLGNRLSYGSYHRRVEAVFRISRKQPGEAERSLMLPGARLVHPLKSRGTVASPFGTLAAGMMLPARRFFQQYGLLFSSAILCSLLCSVGRRTNLRTSTDGLLAAIPDRARNDNRFPPPPRWH